MKKFAVILAAYNPKDYFDVQLDSILNQSDVLVDIFIFDDGSSDDCKHIYERYSIFDNVKIIPNMPSGSPGKNFLRALKDPLLSGYDFYAFSDQDDLWLNSKLVNAERVLKLSNAEGYSSNLSIFEDEKITGELVKCSKQKKYDYIFQGASAGCTYVFTKRLFEKCVEVISEIDILKIENSVSHDWFVYYTARVHNLSWVMDDCSYILYRQHSNNNFGAKISLVTKAKMILGDWYKANACFLRKTRKNELDDIGVFRRVLMIRNIFEFRRHKIESVVVYFLWLLRGF
jgi:rhamnosyltransferase